MPGKVYIQGQAFGPRIFEQVFHYQPRLPVRNELPPFHAQREGIGFPVERVGHGVVHKTAVATGGHGFTPYFELEAESVQEFNRMAP